MSVRDQYLGTDNGRHNGHSPDARPGPRPPWRDTMPGRVPPHSIEAEEALLGSMLIGGVGLIDDVRQKFPATDAFFVPQHQVIYAYLLQARDQHLGVDLVTFTQLLRDHHELESVGGTIFLTHLFTFVPTPTNWEYYAETVREKAILRGIIVTAGEAQCRAYEEQSAVDELLDDFAGQVIDLGMRHTGDTIRHISDFVPEALEQIKALYYNRGKITGLATGFVDFDRMTNGLEPGYNYVIGARPAMGKTSFGLGMVDYIAVQNAAAGHTVQIFSLEMTGVQLARRLICAAASISLSAARFGFLPKSAIPEATAAAEKLVASKILIDDQAGLNIYEFRARMRRAALKHKASLGIIDYLGMMHGVSRRSRENRQLEVSECIQGIAETAKELQVPIITLAQLNRSPEERRWGVPEMSDLRESGDIENYAHLIGLLWRPVYYCKNDADKVKCARWLKIFRMERSSKDGELHPIMGPDDQPEVDLDAFERYAQILITKQREGATGPCPLIFVKEYARFESATEKLFSNNPEQRQHNAQEDDF